VPEMPEIQAHAERLTDAFGGTELTGFRPISFTVLKTFAPQPEEAVGHPFGPVGRRGKYLLLHGGPVTFVVHLMQGGRLRDDPKQTAKPRGGLARWTFADGRALLLTEPGHERRAGVWMVAGDPEGQDPLTGLGPEADQVTRDELAAIVGGQGRRLHGLLRNQGALAGIGRRLANEICHRARLSPFATANKLDGDEIDRLHAAIGACIAETLAEERTRDDLGSVKERTSAVHNRVGEPCPVCGDTIRTVSYRAYTVSYCPTCQTNGKVLADNTTSKFLK